MAKPDEMKTAKYSKLKDGGWGVSVDHDMNDPPEAGETVLVITKAKEEKEETIDRVLFTGESFYTNGDVSLCTIEDKRRQENRDDRRGSRDRNDREERPRRQESRGKREEQDDRPRRGSKREDDREERPRRAGKGQERDERRGRSDDRSRGTRNKRDEKEDDIPF